MAGNFRTSYVNKREIWKILYAHLVPDVVAYEFYESFNFQ